MTIVRHFVYFVVFVLKPFVLLLFLLEIRLLAFVFIIHQFVCLFLHNTIVSQTRLQLRNEICLYDNVYWFEGVCVLFMKNEISCFVFVVVQSGLTKNSCVCLEILIRLCVCLRVQLKFLVLLLFWLNKEFVCLFFKFLYVCVFVYKFISHFKNTTLMDEVFLTLLSL